MKVNTLLNTIVNIEDGYVFYFDNSGIYRRLSLSEAKKMKFNNLILKPDGSANIVLMAWKGNVLRKIIVALMKLKEGDTVSTFKKYLQQ